jgi:tetratricopeptide (TPR) repeat protein
MSNSNNPLRTPPGRWKSVRFLAAALLFLTSCSTSPQAREAKYMTKGEQYVAARKYREAAIEFKVASQNMPKDAEPQYQLGMTYLKGGNARLAVEAFTKAIALNPKHEGAQYEMALVKVDSNKPEFVVEASKTLSTYLTAHSADAEAMGAQALAQAKLGNKAESLRLLGNATAQNSADTRSAAMVIGFYAAKGDIETAKQIAHDLSARSPNSPDAAVLRAQVSLAMRDLADADAQIGRALSLKRDFRPALELRLRRELMEQNNTGAEETTRELARLPEKRTWAAYARMLFAEKRVDEGIAEYNRVLKEHDNDPELRDEYSDQLISARRGNEAEAIVAGTLSKNSKDRIALLQRVKLEIDKGNQTAASADVKTLQDLKAFSAQLSYQESRLFAARGEFLRQGDLVAEALKYNPRFLQARLDLSRLLINSGKARVALQILDQASPSEKGNPEFVYYHNMALMSLGDWTEARRSVDEALAISHSAGFLYQDAVLRLRNHDLPGARKSLDAAFAAAPTDPLTLGLLGKVMNAQKEGPKYLAILKEAAAKNPASTVLQNKLAGELETTGDVKSARSAFEAAKAAGDSNADIQLALLDVRTGASDRAKQRLQETIKTHDSAAARLMLAQILNSSGASADIVVGHYLKAIQLEPQNVAAMNNLASILATRERKFDDALFWAQKALGESPASPVVEDTIGWIYYQQGKYDAALPYLEKALKGVDRPVAHYHLAAALASSGDEGGGRKEYQIALKEDPKSAARADASPLFEAPRKK